MHTLFDDFVADNFEKDCDKKRLVVVCLWRTFTQIQIFISRSIYITIFHIQTLSDASAADNFSKNCDKRCFTCQAANMLYRG